MFTTKERRLTPMRFWIGLCLLFIGGALATPASAQTPPAGSRTAVGAGESFTVAITPPTTGQPTGLRLYLDGVKVGSDIGIPATAGAEATVLVPGINTPGAHKLEATTFNDAGESAKRSLDFWVGPPPVPGLRITIVTTSTQVFETEATADGGVGLRLVQSDTSTVIK